VQSQALSPAELFQPSFVGEIYVIVSCPYRLFKNESFQLGQLCKVVFGEGREMVKVRSTDHEMGNLWRGLAGAHKHIKSCFRPEVDDIALKVVVDGMHKSISKARRSFFQCRLSRFVVDEKNPRLGGLGIDELKGPDFVDADELRLLYCEFPYLNAYLWWKLGEESECIDNDVRIGGRRRCQRRHGECNSKAGPVCELA
jgi:hypothetical protein